MLALVGVGGLSGTPARADWLYTYNGRTSYPSSYPAPAFQITLDITNAAVQSGSFTLSGTGQYAGPVSPPPAYRGDAADLVDLTVTGMGTATPGYFANWNAFDIAFSFDPATAAITSDRIWFLGPSDDGLLTGNQSLTSGALGSDGPWCNSDYTTGRCTVSGSWSAVDPPGAVVSGAQSASATPVPEPAGFAVLGAGLLGLAAARCRARG
jgi:hypothetical protein